MEVKKEFEGLKSQPFDHIAKSSVTPFIATPQPMARTTGRFITPSSLTISYLFQDHTWVCILFRPLNHNIWPRRSSLSAWSISSTSSANSSSGISSFWVPWPASLRNFKWLVGIVDINYNHEKEVNRLVKANYNTSCAEEFWEFQINNWDFPPTDHNIYLKPSFLTRQNRQWLTGVQGDKGGYGKQ